MSDWSLTGVFDVVGSTIPDREMVVWGDVRRTFGDALARADALSAFLRERGLGIRRERAELENWECGQDRVAVLMHNRPEHVETILACWRARAVPCNVNYQYTAAEIAELFRMLGTRGVVYERGLAPLLRAALAELDTEVDVLVELDDGSTEASIPGAVDFETVVAHGGHLDDESSPDDIYIACTGGTTGRPKAVLWRQGDLFVAAIGGTDDMDEAKLRKRAEAGAGVWFPTSPLMHVAAQWTVFLAASMGATVVLHDDSRRFDAPTILATAARERANMMTIIGDAYARPLLEELRTNEYDLSALAVLGTGGTPTSAGAKDALAEMLPGVTIRDGYGASEIGVMGSGDQAGRVAQTQRFQVVPSARILAEDRSRFLSPGETEVGWIVRTGHVPLGYLDDEAATNATFPVVEGERVAVAGDRAQFTDDGQVVLLGRDSLVVNTGGEKVFVEEVEDVLRRHDAVVDVLVTGRPSERFGQEVVAIVQLTTPDAASPAELRAWCGEHLARYKAPRAVAFVEEVRRHPSGKADYRWAKEQATAAVEATGT
ncbi:MAG TPA: AMP-binding protein [Acidimicrobiia bacterium]|nr:AMP-binding protein [Acidimicrobiia bacterium]